MSLIPLPLIAPELDSLGASRDTMTIDAALVRRPSGNTGEPTGEANVSEPLHPSQYELKDGKNLGSGRQ